ncbi:MAG: DoxX-like family protein [Polaribacter sp.]|uniref:DoxX-like family protein n=1 Tax=Polaribacter sp. TaxID=1920175 RepID=UPI003BB1DAF8
MNRILTVLISTIWFANGFLCKILNLVPRHQEIVARILNEEFAKEITFTIGVLEIIMVVWILSSFKTKLNAITQIIIVLAMNVIEFFLVENLLLFGKMNIIFALFFCLIIYYNQFVIKIKNHV